MIQEPVTTTVLLIAGMRDHMCRQRIAKALALTHDVEDVEVNLYRARATVVHGPSCGVADLVKAVVQAGCAAEIAPVQPGGKAAGTGDGPDPNSIAGKYRDDGVDVDVDVEESQHGHNNN